MQCCERAILYAHKAAGAPRHERVMLLQACKAASAQCCERAGVPVCMSPVSEQGEPPRWRGQGDPTPAPDPAPGACPCAAAPATASRPGLGKALLASIWGQIPQPGALLIPCGQRTSRMADTGGCGQLSCPTRGKSGHPPLPSPTTSQQAPNLPRFPITIRLSKKTPTHPTSISPA